MGEAKKSTPDLIERLRRGDEAAMRLVYDLFCSRLVRRAAQELQGRPRGMKDDPVGAKIRAEYKRSVHDASQWLSRPNIPNTCPPSRSDGLAIGADGCLFAREGPKCLLSRVASCLGVQEQDASARPACHNVVAVRAPSH